MNFIALCAHCDSGEAQFALNFFDLSRRVAVLAHGIQCDDDKAAAQLDFKASHLPADARRTLMRFAAHKRSDGLEHIRIVVRHIGARDRGT